LEVIVKTSTALERNTLMPVTYVLVMEHVLHQINVLVQMVMQAPNVTLIIVVVSCTMQQQFVRQMEHASLQIHASAKKDTAAITVRYGHVTEHFIMIQRYVPLMVHA